MSLLVSVRKSGGYAIMEMSDRPQLQTRIVVSGGVRSVTTIRNNPSVAEAHLGCKNAVETISPLTRQYCRSYNLPAGEVIPSRAKRALASPFFGPKNRGS